MNLIMRRGRTTAAAAFSALLIGGLGLTVGAAVLNPRTDAPSRVDALVVVAGAEDDRYVYARHLAEQGTADHLLISQPRALHGFYADGLDEFCEATPVVARDGRRIAVECFTPDVNTTEGEAAAATRLAHTRGWDSLLVVTYWGHVSRARIYFNQCFNGSVYVTDTPRPLSASRSGALLHETGGYVKAFLMPAC